MKEQHADKKTPHEQQRQALVEELTPTPTAVGRETAEESSPAVQPAEPQHFHRVTDRSYHPNAEELVILSHQSLPTGDPRRSAEMRVEQRYRPIDHESGRPAMVSEEVTYVETFDSRRKQQEDAARVARERALKDTREIAKEQAKARGDEDEREIERVKDALFVSDR